MSIQDIVNVQITRETKAVSRQGFSTILVLGVNKAFTALSKSYSKYSDVLIDFQSTDPEAVSANTIFAQSPSVTSMKIGRRATSDTMVVTVVTVQNSTQYSITVNGTVFNITSSGSATAVNIATQLVGAITGVGVTPTDNLDGTFDLDPTVPSTDYSVKVDSKLSYALTTSDTVANDLANISLDDDDWYGLVYTKRVQVDQVAIATYIETVKKIFGTASSDTNIANTTDSADTTSLPAVLKSSSFARSFVMYLTNAGTQFPEAGLLGRVLPLDPGSWDAAFKTLVSITVDNNSPTQRTNILAKNATQYTTVGGVNITEVGKVAEGDYLDVIVFVDWLDSRITEEVYSLLVNSPKVPYTDGGITLIQSRISGVLQDGVTVGGLASTPAFVVTVPKASEVSVGDKASRTLNGVTFVATLAGSIQQINIQGTVQL
ncbi:MAG: DUF3383 domain-containing protein [Scytonema sp. CRU_2_7]|nr:DUF3383 domain-containing protein [Scytonema sp. CRU_2_7]